MEELDLSSHVVRIFRHDYHLSAEKQMNRESGLLGVVMLANNADDTGAETGTPAGNVMICYEGVTLTQWRCESFTCVECLCG